MHDSCRQVLRTVRGTAHDDNAGHRGDGPYLGRGDSRFGLQGLRQRDRHVQAPDRRAPSEGGRQPPCRRRRARDLGGPRQSGDGPGGHRPRVVLHGPRPGPLPPHRRHRRPRPFRVPEGAHSRGQPLHSAHRDRPRPDGMHRSRPPVRVRGEHPGDSLFYGPLQDLRGDPGHRHRQYAGQARQGPRHGLLRRAGVREAGQGGRQVLRAPVLGQGHGRGLLRADDRRAGAPQEGRPPGGHSVLRAGDGLRHVDGGHRARHGPHRQGRGPPRGRRGPEHAPEGDGGGDGPREGRRDVRPGPQVLHGQRCHDRMARERDVLVRCQDGRIGHRRQAEVQDRRGRGHLEDASVPGPLTWKKPAALRSSHRGS